MYNHLARRADGSAPFLQRPGMSSTRNMHTSITYYSFEYPVPFPQTIVIGAS